MSEATTTPPDDEFVSDEDYRPQYDTYRVEGIGEFPMVPPSKFLNKEIAEVEDFLGVSWGLAEAQGTMRYGMALVAMSIAKARPAGGKWQAVVDELMDLEAGAVQMVDKAREVAVAKREAGPTEPAAAKKPRANAKTKAQATSNDSATSTTGN